MLSASAPFEGPEKLLEVWFAPSPAHIPDANRPKNGKIGLRKVPRVVWEDMLAVVKCKVLSVIEGDETDAYLLSESSLFVFAHRIILKTCGTTLNLLGLPGILDIARDYASLPSVYQCFYSRKSFMFPERQLGPHREWKDEVAFLDAIFPRGAAYTVGKVNGDHWLLYITSPSGAVPSDMAEVPPPQDYTIEILMSDLSPEAREPFFFSAPPSPRDDVPADQLPSILGQTLSTALQITEIFPPHLTTLDAYAFSPCGYSSNALLNWGDTGPDRRRGEGYYTIHVTPEEGWSYASFECNVPLSSRPSSKKDIPDIETLVRRVVNIFRPARLSLTLFISSRHNNSTEEEGADTTVEVAQRAFKAALTSSSGGLETGSGDPADPQRVYRRTDKINYEFGGYDLAFASFELR
ncbi:S-adenosylmethionine decarboxylase [Pisolithus croceorrhizus]|nr:S-adenosylmethionine decarboxylase [Pisolithus croceorrhizus]